MPNLWNGRVEQYPTLQLFLIPWLALCIIPPHRCFVSAENNDGERKYRGNKHNKERQLIYVVVTDVMFTACAEGVRLYMSWAEGQTVWSLSACNSPVKHGRNLIVRQLKENQTHVFLLRMRSLTSGTYYDRLSNYLI